MSNIIILPPGLVVLGGEVVFAHIYRCADCGRSGRGDSNRCRLDQLERMNPSAHSMPVGWSHGPIGVFRCHYCNSS